MLHFALLCVFSLVNVVFSNELYNAGIVSDGIVLKHHFDQEDPHCTHHIHKLYRHMKCEPEMSPGAKCPTSYKCATLEGRSPELCYYGGRSYSVGSNLTKNMVAFHSPCIQSCQCVRMYEGARFYCSHDSPGPQNCPAPQGCHHYSFMEDFTCCQRDVVSCKRGKALVVGAGGEQDSVKCVFGGLTYSEGEKFFPQDDITCGQCICASGFNGTLSPPYCQQFSCDLELWGDTPIMLTRGCIPVYLSDQGCCPISFRCPKRDDRVIKQDTNGNITNKSERKCRFGNLTMSVGERLALPPRSKRAAKVEECSCRVPPIASCIRRNFKLTDELRRKFAREGLDNRS